MNILITSVSSYVGRYIAKSLLLEGYSVAGTFRTHSPIIDNLIKRYGLTPIQHIYNYQSPITHLPEQYDIIINSSGAFPFEDTTTEDVLALNIKNSVFITNQILSQEKKPRILIDYSTLSVYGDLRIDQINDQTRPSPSNIYGSSKLLSEHILDTLSNLDISIVHMRFPVVLGKGAHRAWLPVLLDNLTNNSPISLNNPESKYNSCTTLEAVFQFTKHLCYNPPKGNIYSFPLSSIPDLKLVEIIDLLILLTNSTSSITYKEQNQPCCYVNSKVAIDIGYNPPLTSEAITYWIASI